MGADAYPEIIQDGLLRGPAGAPIAQSTVFGWILSGMTSQAGSNPTNCIQSHIVSLHTCIEIDSRLKTFWELESPPNKSNFYTDEEQKCEIHFLSHHRKALDGRYIVRLPMRENVKLGESRNNAINRFYQLEKRLLLNPKLKASYIEFMREYISLGHMKHSTANQSGQSHRYYLPHHAVVKESSSTTKVRVVFDASAKSSNGYALNELMMIGP